MIETQDTTRHPYAAPPGRRPRGIGDRLFNMADAALAAWRDTEGRE